MSMLVRRAFRRDLTRSALTAQFLQHGQAVQSAREHDGDPRQGIDLHGA